MRGPARPPYDTLVAGLTVQLCRDAGTSESNDPWCPRLIVIRPAAAKRRHSSDTVDRGRPILAARHRTPSTLPPATFSQSRISDLMARTRIGRSVRDTVVGGGCQASDRAAGAVRRWSGPPDTMDGEVAVDVRDGPDRAIPRASDSPRPPPSSGWQARPWFPAPAGQATRESERTIGHAMRGSRQAFPSAADDQRGCFARSLVRSLWRRAH